MEAGLAEPVSPPKREQKEIPRGNGVMTEVTDIVVAETTSAFILRAADLRPWGMGKYTGRRTSPTYNEIAQLAYSLYESRGRQDGHDMEDWLRAEQELVRHYA
jgi:hypothetical protein